MISLVTDSGALPQPRDPFTLRIVSAVQAYGINVPFLDVWQGNGCLFSRMDGVLTIAGIPQETEETALFIASCGVDEVLCAEEAAQVLGLSPTEAGPVLHRKQPGEPVPVPADFPSPRALYQVLSDCEGEHFPVPEFEPFYLDTSHRLRHGTAAAVLAEEDGKPAACALALAVTDTAALLTAAAVCPPFRHRGLGSQMIERLAGQLPGREIFLFRSERENRAFYEQLGFVCCGRWAQCQSQERISEGRRGQDEML